ncbi:hypothetical protein HS961_07035 [Comamonas piscis]|uniref:Uncharacterized protein n=1 Tax=Comamonas piscis TaxID=1562974 RepID=A0A7G5EF37_9BURK|nr:hypothetical protein [Comamonas piscis]QMV72612.1 hypothetical protein HS961_07035 [Comamonas piscis]WSO35379.1 hypothetical protein VUJ63_07055 [Comamonas piscis]
MDIYGINVFINAAKRIIKDEGDLKYAALELRFAFERLAYRQIEQYKDDIPSSLVNQWKPDQIIKTLATFDPIGVQSGRLTMIAPDASGGKAHEIELGETRVIPWRKFVKLYNKLGSYLHLPFVSGEGVKKNTLSKDDLERIIEELLEVVSGATLVLAIRNVVWAQCTCGTRLVMGLEVCTVGEVVYCSNKKCNSPWVVEKNDKDETVLAPVKMVGFKCQKCESRIHINMTKLFEVLKCPNCNVEYDVFYNYKLKNV